MRPVYSFPIFHGAEHHSFVCGDNNRLERNGACEIYQFRRAAVCKFNRTNGRDGETNSFDCLRKFRPISFAAWASPLDTRIRGRRRRFCRYIDSNDTSIPHTGPLRFLPSVQPSVLDRARRIRARLPGAEISLVSSDDYCSIFTVSPFRRGRVCMKGLVVLVVDTILQSFSRVMTVLFARARVRAAAMLMRTLIGALASGQKECRDAQR